MIVTADSGSAANWYARHLKFRGDMRGSLSGTLATMGPGVPYAIGAKFAHPDRPVIALVGDGAMQMNGMAELITIAALLAAVGRPAAGRGGAAQQRPQPGDLGDARDGRRAEVRRVPDPSRRRLRRPSPRSLGLHGISVDEPDDLGTAWDAAPCPPTGRPCWTSACDPDVPPIPPHATLEQMKDAAKAMLHGDEDRWGVLREGIKTKAQEFLPHRKD